MEKYISKSAIMAEIDFILNETNYKPFTDEVLGERKVCRDIKDFLNTCVTKEVNLEKEIHKFIDKEELHLRLWDVDRIAKHFFELGLKTQKGE